MNAVFGEWVPVSERYPEEEGIYLVTIKSVSGFNYRSIFTYGSYKGNDGSKLFDVVGFYDMHPAFGFIPHEDDVIAWMPIPDTYQGE